MNLKLNITKKRFLTIKPPHTRSQAEYLTKLKNAPKLLRILLLSRLPNLLQGQFHIKLETQVDRRTSLEKVAIAKTDKRDRINKRYKLFYSCPHFKKLHLKLKLFVILVVCMLLKRFYVDTFFWKLESFFKSINKFLFEPYNSLSFQSLPHY